MSYSFLTTNKSKYFSRNGDYAFYYCDFFLLKTKVLHDNEKIYQKPFIGFVVNRKVGNAVVRNKVKRRLRMIFNSADLNCNFCYILIAKPSIVNVDFDELKSKIIYGISYVSSRGKKSRINDNVISTESSLCLK